MINFGALSVTIRTTLIHLESRMKTALAFVTIIILCVSSSDAQRNKPRTPLETGHERNLGVVYKTVGQRNLEFDTNLFRVPPCDC